MRTIPKIYTPAVFLSAPNFGSIDLDKKGQKIAKMAKKRQKKVDFVKNCKNAYHP
jgi:hypothetical protein